MSTDKKFQLKIVLDNLSESLTDEKDVALREYLNSYEELNK